MQVCTQFPRQSVSCGPVMHDQSSGVLDKGSEPRTEHWVTIRMYSAAGQALDQCFYAGTRAILMHASMRMPPPRWQSPPS